MDNDNAGDDDDDSEYKKSQEKVEKKGELNRWGTGTVASHRALKMVFASTWELSLS